MGGSLSDGSRWRDRTYHLDRGDGAAAEAGLVAVLVADGHRLVRWLGPDERGDGGDCLRVAHDGEVEVVAGGGDPPVVMGLMGVVEREFGVEQFPCRRIPCHDRMFVPVLIGGRSDDHDSLPRRRRPDGRSARWSHLSLEATMRL
jgi:hypothetical protein